MCCRAIWKYIGCEPASECPEKILTPPIVATWQVLWKDLAHSLHDSIQRNITVIYLRVM